MAQASRDAHQLARQYEQAGKGWADMPKQAQRMMVWAVEKDEHGTDNP